MPELSATGSPFCAPWYATNRCVVRLTHQIIRLSFGGSSLQTESARGDVARRALPISSPSPVLAKSQDNVIQTRRLAGRLFLRREWCVSDTPGRTRASDEPGPPNWRGVDRTDGQEDGRPWMTTRFSDHPSCGVMRL